jgi:hypothetical protein
MGRVVHCKKAPKNSFVYIGRPSPLGNPFLLRDASDDVQRIQVIEKYRNWFNIKIEEDPVFRAQVEAVRGKDLGCWCAPRPCHGDVIVEWLAEHSI